MLNSLGFKDSNAYRVLQKSCYTFNFGYFRLKLNIVKNVAHINKYCCITDTIYIYKKLLNIKSRPIRLKELKYSLWLQENWHFKIPECRKHDCSSEGTTFESLRVPKGSFSIRKTSVYKPRSHQKGSQERLMPENDKTGTEEGNFNLHSI